MESVFKNPDQLFKTIKKGACIPLLLEGEGVRG